jgi:hypothetical protein
LIAIVYSGSSAIVKLMAKAAEQLGITVASPAYGMPPSTLRIAPDV